VGKKKGTVGERLTTARLESGLTINEVQQITKIQMRYLEAIEQDQYANLPGVFYVRAFIRQYANAVGENADDLIDIYDGKIEPYAPDPEELPEIPAVKKVKKQRSTRHDNRVKSALPFIVLGIFALAILAVVLYFMFAYQGIKPMINTDEPFKVDHLSESSTSKDKDFASSNSSSAKIKKDAMSPSSKSKKIKIAKIAQSDNNISLLAKNINEQAEIQIKALEEQKTWIQINNANNEILYSGTVETSNPFTPMKLAEGTKQFAIIIGAPAYTYLTINGIKVDTASYNSNRPLTFTIYLEYIDESSSSISSTKSQ
jgi:cytoskeletal protein RodZ